MTVRSATRKKLLELNLPEEYAVQLATDRTMSQVEAMTPAQIAQVTNCSEAEASRVHERIVSKDAHEIERRMKFRDCTNSLHMSMLSVEADVMRLADESGRIDVNGLLRDHLHETEGESGLLQEDVFVEVFRDDLGKATDTAIFLVSKKVDVPLAVISGFLVQFVSLYHLKITLRDIREEKFEGVVNGLAACGRLDGDVANFLTHNIDLAKIADTEICKGDIVIEKFPMNFSRDKSIFDLHPDDLRWPSPYNGKHGLVINRGCSGVLCVEFGEVGRPRAFIHESFCRAMPSNRNR
tara:strand:- start:99 stop:983 length:885 start_codon:yes stop_codon:yes gene_type:complete